MKKVLVVGVGSIGQRHLRCFQQTGRAQVSLCEINPDLRRQVAEQYGVAQTYSDLDAALKDPPELTVIATPAPLHIPMAQKLAEAGVHLLVEKPLSTSLDGIDALGKILGKDKTIPVILNTGYSNYRDNFMTWSADAYVVKSGDLTELKERINEVLNKRPGK